MDPITILGLVGMGLGTATSMGSAIFNATKDTPNVPGPTGSQKLGQALMQSKANQLASGQGLSETEYNRPLGNALQQTAQMAAQGMEATRNVSPFISNIVAERIAKTFSQKSADVMSETRKDLTAMDIQAARENLKASISAQQAANQEANVIAQQEQERQAKLEAYRQQKLQGIATAAGGAATSMLKLVEIGSKPSAVPQAGEVPSPTTVTGNTPQSTMGLPSELPKNNFVTNGYSKAAELQFNGGSLFPMFATGYNYESPINTALNGYTPSWLDDALAGYNQ